MAEVPTSNQVGKTNIFSLLTFFANNLLCNYEGCYILDRFVDSHHIRILMRGERWIQTAEGSGF
jgi:hypothetical protein